MATLNAIAVVFVRVALFVLVGASLSLRIVQQYEEGVLFRPVRIAPVVAT